MLKVHYKLKIGGWSVDSADDPRTELLELETRRALATPTEVCRVTLYAPPAPQPSLLEQAVGAAMAAVGLGGEGAAAGFSVEVRGQPVKPGDSLTLELRAGGRSGTVITAAVDAVRSSLEVLTITGQTGLHALAQTRINQVYQNQTLGQIVRDIAGQAGIAVGEVERGSTYPFLAIPETKSLLRVIRELAFRDGLDLYCDARNRLNLRKWTKTSADHTFHYGIDILDLWLRQRPPTSEQVRIYGESPASQQGDESWHWLVKDLSAFRGEAGSSPKALAIADGAVRTKAAASQYAVGKLGALTDQAAHGRLKLLGRPDIDLADAIEIVGAPQPELNGLFKVTGVRHVFNRRDGFVTLLDFTGQGGARAAGGMLGQLAGAAGAIGL